MKTFQIEDAKTRFFQSKEDYLKFKQAWKDFHNNEPLVEWKDLDITFWDAPHDAPRVYARTKYPVLSSSHYMLYNLLRGYDITRGYVPLTNEGRLTANLYMCDYDPDPWQNCIGAAKAIISRARALENVNNESRWQRDNARKAVAYMMKPFGDTLSHEALAEIGGMLYKHFSGEDLPKIIVQEYKVIEEPKSASIADKVKSWRTA